MELNFKAPCQSAASAESRGSHQYRAIHRDWKEGWSYRVNGILWAIMESPASGSILLARPNRLWVRRHLSSHFPAQLDLLHYVRKTRLFLQQRVVGALT